MPIAMTAKIMSGDHDLDEAEAVVARADASQRRDETRGAHGEAFRGDRGGDGLG